MKYVFEAIKNRFNSSAELVRICSKIHLDDGEGDDIPQQQKPCVIVSNQGSERVPLDDASMEKLSLRFTVYTKHENAHTKWSVQNAAERIIDWFHEKPLPHSRFNLVEMFCVSPSAQPRLEDANWKADIDFELTICWKLKPADLRYV